MPPVLEIELLNVFSNFSNFTKYVTGGSLSLADLAVVTMVRSVVTHKVTLAGAAVISTQKEPQEIMT